MGSILQNADFWVAVGLAILFGGLIVAKVPALGMKMLDDRGERVKAALDEALRLRQEAEALLQSLKAQRIETEKLAAEMLANAEAEANRLRAEAKVKLDETIKRREDMAERKIAIAEAQALADVKAAAADLAAQLAETVLTARLTGLKSDPLVDAAVSQMADKFQ